MSLPVDRPNTDRLERRMLVPKFLAQEENTCQRKKVHFKGQNFMEEISYNWKKFPILEEIFFNFLSHKKIPSYTKKWACSSECRQKLDKYWKVNEGGQWPFIRKKTHFFENGVFLA